MLSIGKIAVGQHRYYSEQVAEGRDDYYSGCGEAPGAWTGRGAKALGLHGELSADQFDALIAGFDPRHPQSRLRSTKQEPKIAAFDLTFSAPKSVSVLFATAPQETSRALVACHEEAVRAARSYIEDTAIMVRRGPGGRRAARAEGLIAAAYRHRMSRALDPQLHTHVVVANLARGPDGRFTALHSTLLYEASKTTGTLYQAHLRALVSERLGLDWGEVIKGAAELASVPREVIEHFSRRRQEMERAARDGGIVLRTKGSAEKAAIATRDRKRYGLDTHTWREEIKARAGELGFGEREIGALLAVGRARVADVRVRRAAIDERALGDRLVSPIGLTCHANTFDERPVLQEFASAARPGALVAEVRAQAARFCERADVIPVERGHMTTAELLATERTLIASAVGRSREGAALIDAATVERAIAAADRPLTGEQDAAVRYAVGSGDGITVIQALAGTGKTYTAGVLRAVYESAGYEVLGVAPTGRAVRELHEEAEIPARTLDRLLVDVEVLGDELQARSVLIFDDAGMAPTRASARLLEIAEAARAKVIAIGDPGQLASVQAGGWLRAVGDALGVLTLSEVMRQRDPSERRALAALHDGVPALYVVWANADGRIETFDTPHGACAQALARWAQSAGAVGRGQAVMVARDNETREELNRRAREVQRDAGALGEERSYGAVSLAVGDRVICRRNDRGFDVDNGMRGTVRHVEQERVVIDTDGGLVRELPAAYVQEHMEHAYALTGHGMQGGTVEAAIVVACPRDLTAGWSYTALSRARGETRLLVYEERHAEERSEFSPRDPGATKSRDELLAKVTRAMAQRDDEDLAIHQLPGVGRPGDRALGAASVARSEPGQEQAAIGAEPTAPETASVARLRELRGRAGRLRAQLDAVPSHELQRIDDLEGRTRTLTEQREEIAARLSDLSEPRRRFGRVQDSNPVERAHLTGALEGAERELDATRTQRARLARELGDPAEVRAERDGLRSALGEVERERIAMRNELAERELGRPSRWVTETFGESPEHSRLRGTWEQGVRAAARYRLEYEVTDPADALGPKPEQRDQRRAWERASEAVERGQRRLGREVTTQRELGRDIGL